MNLTTGHPRRVVLTGVLVAKGVASPQPGFPQSLDLHQQFG
jgi:hypothetical protein